MSDPTLEVGKVYDLAIDGSRVFIEAAEKFCLVVVPLPEQGPEPPDGKRVFTPGRVGGRKISPMAKGTLVEEISERNQKFIDTYVALREQHGQNYIGDDELRVEAEAAAAAPDPKVAKANAKAERKAARDAEKADKKSKAGPRFLQRCVKCDQQPGHPNHPNDHEFEAPPQPVVEIKCAACDKLEADPVHAEGDTFTHRFIRPGKTPRAPKAPKPDAPPKAARPAKASKPSIDGKFRYVDDAGKRQVLAGINGKYNDGNSGAAILDAIKAGGDAGVAPTDVVLTLTAHPRWCTIPLERIELAFQQALAAGLLEKLA